MSVEMVRLGDICDIQIGKTPARNNLDFWGEGFPWLSIADMNQGKLVFVTKEQITEKAVRDCNMKLIPAGSVLMSFKLSIGKLGIAQIPLYTNEAIAALKIKNSGDITPDYLVYALGSINLTKGADRAAMGATLNKEKLHSILIPLPSLERQREIAAVLDKVDDLRAKRRQSIGKLEELLQSTFLDMFGDPVENPKGWEVRKLGEVAQFFSGGTPDRSNESFYSGEIPLITGADITDDKVSQIRFLITEEAIKKSATRIMPKDSILLVTRTGVGKVAVAPRDICISQDFTGIIPNDEINLKYLYYILRQSKPYFDKHKRGATIQGVTRRIVEELNLFLPPQEIQKQFATTFFHCQMSKAKAQAHLQHLDTLYSSLQAEFFGAGA